MLGPHREGPAIGNVRVGLKCISPLLNLRGGKANTTLLNAQFRFDT